MVRGLILLLVLLVHGCVGLGAPPAPHYFRDGEIHADTTWQGEIVIDGQVKVFKGATLTILPGTDIAFVKRDLDRDGLGDGTLVVEGALQALGTWQQPIRFRSAAADPRPGDWLELRVDFSRNTHLRFCEISGSAHTLHAHFTKAVMEDCTIRGNIDGCRLGQGNFILRNCLIEGNEGKGVNFRNSTIEITRNIIRRNGAGIFIFETDRPPAIHHNNVYANTYNVRLGDFFPGDVELQDNWWGSNDPLVWSAGVYDRNNDPGIGGVRLAPAPAWVEATGPRDAVAVLPAWSIASGGFIDAAATAAGTTLFMAGWDGVLTALDATGQPRWAQALGEVMDSPPAVDAEAVYGQDWGRQVFARNRADGAERWRFSYPPSPQDDHRQGGVVRLDELLLVPAWNGILYALDAATGRPRWQFQARPPLRAAVAVAADQIYLSGGDGTLWALDRAGRLRWQQPADAPLLATVALTPAGPVAVSKQGTVTAYSPAGELRWQRRLEQVCFYGAPAVADGALYLGTAAGSLWKLDAASGDVIWRRDGFGPIYGTPLVSAGRVLLGDNSGQLSLIGAENGDLLTAFAAAGPIQSTPAVFGRHIVFGSRDRFLHAVEVRPLPVP